MAKTIIKRKPRILFIDLETSPIKGYTWTTYDANVLKVLEPSKIISVAWKWLGDKKTQVSCLADYPDYKTGELDDKALLQGIWELLDEADIVVAHNGKSFDIKKINARFIFHNINMPSAYEVIDTLKEAKKYFRFDQNNLNSLGEYLQEGKKLSTGGFDLWVSCMEGDLKAWEKMKNYNAGDVDLLEKVYLRFRPYMEHPNLNLITENLEIASCPACLSESVQKRGFAYTRAGRKQRFQCNDCGAWSSGPWQSQKTALA